MKSWLAILCLGVLSACSGMVPVPVSEQERNFEQVVAVEGMDKDAIYVGLRSWIAENFRSAKSVIEYENQDDGILIGNGVIPYPCKGISCLAKSEWTHPFTMKIEVRDQRFRVTYSNINLAWPASYNNGIASPARNAPIHNKSDMDGAKAELTQLTESMRSSLSSGAKSNDW
ncbi:hypothetical protein S7S_01540 [Isoalcanivorax pacificus W11-5]|uniref:DUF4468 domain-containing protein n=1 Tax=Isoalcanivorax pacificus W11-5 TaxID=391936 RepID=A0A0B4XJX7_9GAMM|nr:DUF4468 domain-containing protein [Isoalcanivorax pacificus]AJD46732.1 hypothetical protein S7S_01540 [Isoalcanivorax pacificus W11-5]